MASFESPSPSGGKVRPLSPFVSKLKLLLSDPKYRDAIRWSVSGEAIVIFDADTFKRIILDKTAEMFKTKNFTSFVRQLNLYGFRKVPTYGKSDPNKNMKFEHPNFVQHKPQMMHLVQRTCNSSKKRKLDSDSAEFQVNRKAIQESRSQLRAQVRGGGKGESHVREKAAWLNEYYSMATKEGLGGHGMASPAREEESSSRESEFEEDESFALEYMYRKFNEEQNAVQLLMYLKYSQPNPAVFPTWGSQFNPHLQTNYLLENPTTTTTTESTTTTATMQDFFSKGNLCPCFGCQENFVKTERAD